MLPDVSVLAGAGIAAGVTALVSFWGQAKNFARYLAGFVLFQKTVKGSLTFPVARHIRHAYRRAPSGLSSFHAILRQIDDRSMSSYVPFEMPSGIGLWWGRRGVYFVNASGGNELLLVSLRFVSNPRGLIEDAINADNDRSDQQHTAGGGNFYVSRVIGNAGQPLNLARLSNDGPNVTGNSPEVAMSSEYWSNPDIGVDKSFMYTPDRYVQNKKQRGPLYGLFFDQDAHDTLDHMQNWFKREPWYRKHGIPWRTGVLLHGPGGTGKSSLARASAQTLGIPLYQFYLNTLSDKEFLDRWEEMHTPCVVALEDFDTVFNLRESVTSHKSLSFQCVLNAISGISSLNGILLVVTTNDITKIDPALGQIGPNGMPTRPGRIDRVVYMGETTIDQRQQIAMFTLDDPSLVSAMVAKGNGTTAAQFQMMCVEEAFYRLSIKSTAKNDTVIPFRVRSYDRDRDSRGGEE